MTTMDRERAISRRVIARLHPGNRLRLMAGYSLLPESDGKIPDLEQMRKEAIAEVDALIDKPKPAT